MVHYMKYYQINIEIIRLYIPIFYNQGVTDEMRVSDRQLHWWYRAREQGADELLPDWIYDD